MLLEVELEVVEVEAEARVRVRVRGMAGGKAGHCRTACLA
jgi:hypothetical protein